MQNDHRAPGRLVGSAEVAAAVAFMASATYVSGATLLLASGAAMVS